MRELELYIPVIPEARAKQNKQGTHDRRVHEAVVLWRCVYLERAGEQRLL
jgi:hypothetical protein